MLPVQLRVAAEEGNDEQGKNKGVPKLQEPLLGRPEKAAKARSKGQERQITMNVNIEQSGEKR